MADRKERRGRGGFTTLEMLLTTLILALATAVGATGVYTTNTIYKRTMAKSDAQMLLSQAEARLRDELGFAGQVEKIALDNGKGTVDAVAYLRSGGAGAWDTILIDSDGILCKYHDTGSDGAARTADKRETLVSHDKERMEGLKETYEKIDVTPDGCVTIVGLAVKRDGPELARSGGGSITIRCLNDA